MVCPCCGGEMAADGLSCACGAKVVGPPLTEPDYVVPQVGRSVVALVFSIISIIAFVWKWPIVFALAAIFLARNSLKNIKLDPRHFGGRRTAITALSLSILVTLGVITYVAAGIPKYLQLRTERQRAATRAQMYSVAIALHDYKHKHGSYPVSLNLLQVEVKEPMVLMDFWENSLKYQATAEVAADSLNETSPTGVLASFNQYQLISPGPDGKLGTADDMVMRDDIIISPSQADIPSEESLEE